MTIQTKAAQHTPGPWREQIRYKDVRIVPVKDESGEVTIAMMGNWHSDYTDEQEANARLIAAAPELLAELEHALRDVESRLYMLPLSDEYEVSCQKDILSAQIGRYRAAIRKAKGEL